MFTKHTSDKGRVPRVRDLCSRPWAQAVQIRVGQRVWKRLLQKDKTDRTPKISETTKRFIGGKEFKGNLVKQCQRDWTNQKSRQLLPLQQQKIAQKRKMNSSTLMTKVSVFKV